MGSRLRQLITGGFTDNELGEVALEVNRTIVCFEVMSQPPNLYDPVLDTLIFGSECPLFLEGLLDYEPGFLGPLWTASGHPGNPSGNPITDAQMLCGIPNSNKSGYLNAIHSYMGSSGLTQLSGTIFDKCTFTGLNDAFAKGGAYYNMRTTLETIPGVCGPLYNNFPTRVKNTLFVTPGYNALALLLRQNNGQTFIRRTMEQKHSWGFSTMKEGALANNFTYLKMLDDMFIYLPSDLYATIMNDLYGRNGQYQEQLKLQSHNMYGSSRLGVQNSDKLLKRVVYNGIYSSTTGNVTASYTFTNITTKVKKRKVNLFHGQKRYELTDHLGNVVTTISERRVCDSTGTFSAEVITQTGYEPFGAQQAGRQYHAQKDSGYRFGFIGTENDDEIQGNGNTQHHMYRSYDPRIGRYKSIDPLTRNYPWNSPYAYAENRVIDGLDLEGLEYVTIHHYPVRPPVKILYYTMTNKEIYRSGGTPAGLYNSVSFGPGGRGVLHYHHTNEGKTTPRWEMQQYNWKTSLEYNGLFSGRECITFDGLKGSKNYDFSYQPTDWADAIPKPHDQEFAKLDNYAGFLEDVRTLQADKDMIRRIDDYANPYKDVTDVEIPVRTSFSIEMGLTMISQRILIGSTAKYKQWKISNGLGNKDKYAANRKAFRKENLVASIIIDFVKSDDK